MITLRKSEQIEIYQVELALKEKTKQSPFIAVLILAKELWENDEYYIDAEVLQEKLLPTLPLRACENLLERLTAQDYFEEIWEGNDFFGFKLTEIGEQSAIDKSFWVGEKGIYNVYITSSDLIQQDIICIEKGRIEITEQRKQNDGRVNIKEIRTPRFLTDVYSVFVKNRFYDEQKKQLQTTIEKREIRIEDVSEMCFPLQTENCILEIETKEDDALIRIKEKETLFQSSFEINENELKEELLSNTNEFDYEENRKVVLSDFNQDNLSFNRKIKIRNPYFQDNQFNSVEIENVAFIPSNKRNAELWLNEILFKSIDKYFLDEKTFNEFTANIAKPILEHYSVELPTREQLKQIIAERENAFYQTAKLETIDYLNY